MSPSSSIRAIQRDDSSRNHDDVQDNHNIRDARTTAEHSDNRVTLRAWLRLLACTNVIEGRVRSLLREQFDTTLPRFDLLAQLDAASNDSVPGLTMSELSRRMMVTNGNITSLVDRLAREQLISRAVSPTDRRTQIVRITAKGRQALGEITPDHQRWVTSMFAELEPEECAQLYTLLGKLKTSAQLATIDGARQKND